MKEADNLIDWRKNKHMHVKTEIYGASEEDLPELSDSLY